MSLSTELLGKAEKLGLEVTEDTTEEELQNLIDEKASSLNDSGDDNDDSKDPEYYKNEARKAFEARDKAKQERRKLAGELESLRKALEDAPDPTEVKKLKGELKALQDFKSEIEKEREEKELESKSEIEKTKLRFEKQLQDLESKMNTINEERQAILADKEAAISAKEEEISNLRFKSLEADIVKTAAKLNAYSPTQIFKLLRDDFTFDKNLGTFTKVIKDHKGKIVDEFSIEEAVSKFLEDPENDNLVKSDVKSGMSNKSDVTSNSQSNKSKIKGSGYDPKDEELKRKADFAGLSVEDYIEVRLLRDEKLKKIKEQG